MPARFLFVFAFISFSVFSFSQTELDSLKKALITAKDDTNKVKLYNLITDYCSESEIKTFALPAISLSEKLNYSGGLAQAYNNLAFYYQNLGNTDSAINCLQRSILLNLSMKSYFKAAEAWNNLGYIYQRIGRKKDARYAFDSCLFNYALAGEIEKAGYTYLNIGHSFELDGDLKESLNYYYKGLECFKRLKNPDGEAHSYYCLASMHEKQNDLEEAQKYYEMNLKLRRVAKDIDDIAKGCQSLGIVLQKRGLFQQAFDLYEEGLKYSLEIGQTESSAAGYNNIGLYYLKVADYKAALENFQKSLVLTEQINEQNGLSTVLRNIALCYLNLGDIKNADLFGERSLKVSMESGFPDNIRGIAEIMTDIYAKQNRYKEALEMHRLYSQMKDSIVNIENRKAAFKKQINYEYGIKEAEMKAEQEKEAISHAEENKRNRMIIFFVVGGLVVAGFFSVLLYRRFRVSRAQNQIINEQKYHLEEKQKEIIDSINYARYIQKAMLKEEEHISDHLPPHFILFKPKDIVSGDFYWALEKYNHLYFAAADCTGHGVPGAFLTLLGTSFLNDIAGKDDLIKPGTILDQLRDKIIKELSREGKTKDGMDISLLRLNLKSNELVWAGANNPLWLVRKSEENGEYSLQEIKANKQPVGFVDDPKPFTNHVFNLKNGDVIYIFSDGYADQFGGPKGKKYKYKQLEETLMRSFNLEMEEQKKMLEQSFMNWKGNLEQVDDVCIVGIRI